MVASVAVAVKAVTRKKMKTKKMTSQVPLAEIEQMMLENEPVALRTIEPLRQALEHPPWP